MRVRRKTASAILLASCLCLVSVQPARGETFASRDAEAPQSGGGKDFTLAATFIGAGVTMIVVAGFIEPRTVHEFHYEDSQGIHRKHEWTTGNDTDSLFIVGAATVLLGMMFVAFPAGGDDGGAQDREPSGHDSAQLSFGGALLKSGSPAVGCRWKF